MLIYSLGIRSSISFPSASRFSISTNNLTPSTTFWTNSTSEYPKRSLFEISNTPSDDPVSTPPVPLTSLSLACPRSSRLHQNQPHQSRPNWSLRKSSYCRYSTPFFSMKMLFAIDLPNISTFIPLYFLSPLCRIKSSLGHSFSIKPCVKPYLF